MRERCQAQTKAGHQCQNQARSGSRYCHIHQSDETPIAVENEPTAAKDARYHLHTALQKSIGRLQSLAPDFAPPPFDREELKRLTQRLLQELAPYLPLDRLQQIQAQIGGDLLDRETWRGIWYVLSYSVQYQLDFLKRRFTGDYETDEWGLDWEFLEAIRPIFNFLYKYYWRVDATGLAHLPDYSRGVIVANHSGQIPFDKMMIATAVMTDHPAQRIVRNFHEDWLTRLPLVVPFLKKLGQTALNIENGIRLLEQEELVAAYPEGIPGISKPYQDRYKLAPFGQGEFIKMAIAAQAPIIPTAVIGAEEIYVTLGHSAWLARLTGLPYFPISPRFPWLGLIGLIPYPTKWSIDFGPPIATDHYDPQAAEDEALVTRLTNEVQETVQKMVIDRLIKRKSILFRS